MKGVRGLVLVLAVLTASACRDNEVLRVHERAGEPTHGCLRFSTPDGSPHHGSWSTTLADLEGWTFGTVRVRWNLVEASDGPHTPEVCLDIVDVNSNVAIDAISFRSLIDAPRGGEPRVRVNLDLQLLGPKEGVANHPAARISWELMLRGDSVEAKQVRRSIDSALFQPEWPEEELVAEDGSIQVGTGHVPLQPIGE